MKLKIDTHLDGARQVTVTIKPTAGRTDAVISVRPLHQRMVYTGLLSDAILFVVSRHAKALVASQGLPIPRSRKLKR
jgi:hypothetical protein